jgi:hypothetical protein
MARLIRTLRTLPPSMLGLAIAAVPCRRREPESCGQRETVEIPGTNWSWRSRSRGPIRPRLEDQPPRTRSAARSQKRLAREAQGELSQRFVAYATLVDKYKAQNPNADMADIVNNLVAGLLSGFARSAGVDTSYPARRSRRALPAQTRRHEHEACSRG